MEPSQPVAAASAVPTVEPTQYAYRSLKTVGMVTGSPIFAELESFQKPEGSIRAFVYSADGSRYAFAAASQVDILDAATAKPIIQIPAPGVIDIAFSPKGTYISTWERYVKPADENAQHRNMRVWNVETATEIAGFTQKSIEAWACQFTQDESRALRLVSGEIQAFDPSDFSKGPVAKLRLDGMTDFRLGPGRNPHVAAFVAEKKGAPASLKVYSLAGFGVSGPVSQKTFYKADKIQIKWNSIGTSVLFLTQTDVDKTGKSYYGETNLYMLSANGTFDCRVTLDREGGIHDVSWGPSDKEFAVTYGYMPAKTTIFDQRGNVVHDFGTAPRNFLSYNPQGRLLLIAGFGNLAGTMDIWDRRTLKKAATIEASNTVHCEWSPDGRFIMCATLSPRLRVDNGIKVFHYSGALMHADTIPELYAASWRPAPADNYPFRQSLSPAPAASASIQSTGPSTPLKPTGAYRPPHARGTLTPTAYKREDEGGAPYVAPANGEANGMSSDKYRVGGQRKVPGAAVPGMPSKANGTDGGGPGGRNKKKAGGRGDKGSGSGTPGGNTPKGASPLPSHPGTPRRATTPPLASEAAAAAANPMTTPAPASRLAEDGTTSSVPLGQLSPEEKRKRALVKKLTAIEQLKERRDRGEKLEVTQLKKISSEVETRQELDAIG